MLSKLLIFLKRLEPFIRIKKSSSYGTGLHKQGQKAPEENPQEHIWKPGRSVVTPDELVEYLNTTKFQYALLGLSAIS